MKCGKFENDEVIGVAIQGDETDVTARRSLAVTSV
jgi:hypothetical protein